MICDNRNSPNVTPLSKNFSVLLEVYYCLCVQHHDGSMGHNGVVGLKSVPPLLAVESADIMRNMNNYVYALRAFWVLATFVSSHYLCEAAVMLKIVLF